MLSYDRLEKIHDCLFRLRPALRLQFIRYASKQGIPYFQLQGEEQQRELDTIKKL